MKKATIILIIALTVILLAVLFWPKKKESSPEPVTTPLPPADKSTPRLTVVKPVKKPLPAKAAEPAPPAVFSNLPNAKAEEVRNMVLQLKPGDVLNAKINGAPIRFADNPFGSVFQRIPKDKYVGIFKGFARNNFVVIERNDIHDKIFVKVLDVYVGNSI